MSELTDRDLIMRSPQRAAFEAEQLRLFELEAVHHVRTCLPDHYRALGETATLEAVRTGIVEARSHALTSSAGIHIYLRLRFVLGEDFAVRCGWVRAALAPPPGRDDGEQGRVTRLAAAALAHARALASPPTDGPGERISRS